jgi:hypothetical protein
MHHQAANPNPQAQFPGYWCCSGIGKTMVSLVATPLPGSSRQQAAAVIVHTIITHTQQQQQQQ